MRLSPRGDTLRRATLPNPGTPQRRLNVCRAIGTQTANNLWDMSLGLCLAESHDGPIPVRRSRACSDVMPEG
jgi:hypothetical protein